VLLLLVQVAEGTGPIFALLVFGTIMAWVFSFNILGGLDRISGMFVFGQGGLGVLVPELVKAVLREPADSRLLSPNLTMAVYFVGQCVVLGVCYTVARIRPRRALFYSEASSFRTMEMAVGATVLAFLIIVILAAFGKYSSTSGGWASLLVQLSVFMLPFALALSINAEIDASGGERTLNLMVLAIWGYMTYIGFTHSVKEAVITPVVIYIVCCACRKIVFSVIKIAALGSLCLVIVFLVYPLLQSYHNGQTEAGGLSPTEVVDKIIDAPELIAQYNSQRIDNIRDYSDLEYFGRDVGMLGRYSLISLDAGLISSVKDGNYMGYEGIIEGCIDWIPHFIYPNKPVVFNSEFYAHRLAGLSQEDTTTGISFGSFGTSFAMGGWIGLVILITIVEGAFLLIMDALCPSVTSMPWIVCLLAFMMHSGPETNIDALVTGLVLVPVELAFVVLVTRYGVRFFSSFVGGSQRGTQLEEFRQKRARELELRTNMVQL